jgi:uncharacterized repeat protein (TIGR03803 family)
LPQGGLVADSSGNFYGTAYGGGSSGFGTVFEVAPGSGTITALASFTGANGSNPYCTLVRDSSGNLFGNAPTGGTSNDGTVFELAAGSGTITALASFTGANGANPHTGLVADSSGNLYGTTAGGGASSDGTVFEYQQKATTSVALVSSANPSVYGQAVTFIAAVGVVGGSGTPTGTVTFLGGATSLGTATVSNGLAILTTSSLAVAGHSITATYSATPTSRGAHRRR